MVNNSHRSGSYAGKLIKSQVNARFIVILPLVLIGMTYIVHASPFTGGQIDGQYTAAINMTTVTDMFFYDGDMIPIIANYTNLSDGLGHDGLTVTGNFSLVGGSGNISATGLGGGSGLYKLNSTVNFSSITVNNIQPFNISVSGYNGTDYINTTVTALLVNMSTLPGCPPPDVQLPPEAPLSNWTMVGPIAGCNSSCAPNEGPAKWNGTHYVVCGPNFAGSTTNFSDIAKNGDFSSVPLVLDIPGKAKINFTTPVDMGTNEKMQSIFEFAVKLLSSGGKIGFNSSEYSGIDPNKPNLNLSAEITIYNISGLLGISNKPSIGYQQIYTPNGSAPSIVCPPSICSPENIIWDGENITFTITHFSTYVVGSANYTLTFNNLSSTTLSVGPDVNASYVLNVTNYGNTTETYNMSVNGTGTLNVTQITLNPDESTTVLLNVSNSSDGTYYSNVTGILSTNSSIIMNSFEDIGDIVTIVGNAAPNQPQLNSPQNGATNQNLTVTLNITATDPDGDPMNVTFYNNETGQQIANTTNIADGTCANITWPNLNYSTTYNWYANSTDGQYTNKSNVWNFTTKDAPDNPPNVTLNLPQANYYNDTSDPVNVTFNCSAADDNSLTNISLYITNPANQSFALNQTTNITGASNSSTWTLELSSGNYTWNCLVYDNADQSGWGDSNRTLSVNASSAGQNDSYEPDNNYTLANWIATDGVPQSHTFAPAGDTDWIRFNATENAKYIIQTSALGNGADTIITLYEQNGTTNITENDDIEPTVIRRSKIIWTAAGTGTYFVKARDWNASHSGGSYNISITELPNITLSLLGNSSRNVQKWGLFNITLNVSCSGINCTGLEIYLDPEKQKPKRPQQRPTESANLLDRLDSLPEGEYDVIIILKDITAKELRVSKSKLSRQVGVRSTRRPKLEARRQAVSDRQAAVLSGLGASQRSTRTMRTMNTAPDEFTLKRKYNVINALSGRITKQGLIALKNNPDVKSVQLSRKLTISLSSSVPQINADDAWATQYKGVNITGEGQTICVLDTGIDYNHSDFGGANGFPNAKVIGGYDFVNDDNDPWDDHSHGTHCAGIAASQDTTYKGVAPDAKIVAMKVMNASGSGDNSDIIAGIDWCVYHAEELNISVISMSLGGGTTHYQDHTACDLESMAIAINYANDLGIVVTVAAGNEYWTDGVSFPACASGATTVSSIRKDDSTFDYNRGLLTNVVAPGYEIAATYYGGGHASMSGTSMATPHVAGAAALLNQYYKLHDGLNLHAEQIETTLEESGAIKYDGGGSNLNLSRADVLAALSEPIHKGIISTQSNATPFYTLNSNPNITSLDAGTSKQITWTINATGDYATYDFFAFTDLDDGENEVSSNNVNISIVDNTYPLLNIEYPEADAVFNSSTVSFIFNVTDDFDNIFSCSLHINGQLNQTNSSVNEGISTNFTKSLEDENYSWYINCTDAYGNCNFTAARNLTVDTTHPTFSDYKRTPNTPNEDQNVQVNVTISEATDTVILEFNGTTNYTVNTNSGPEYYFTIINGTNYTAHDTITYYWYANDSAGYMNKSEEQSFTVANQLPTVSAPSLNNSSPQTNDIINCTGGTFGDNDQEDTEQNRTYRWYDTSTIISGQTSQTLELSVSGLDKGDDITCSIKVYDNYNWSNWVNSSNNATIQNTAPTHATPILNSSSGTNRTDEDLTCYNQSTSDIDDDAITNKIRWFNNSVAVPALENQTTIAPGNTTKAEAWLCEVTPYDNENYGTPLNSSPLTILNTQLTITADATSPSTIYTNTDWLINLTITDPDSIDTLTGYVQFYVNDALIGSTHSQNALNNTNTLIATFGSENFSKEDNLTAEVWAGDATANTSKTNLTTATVQNAAPTTTTPTLDPTTIYKTTAQVTCSNASVLDADEDTVTWYYQWYVNDVKTITTQTISNSSYSKGDELICEIWASDTESNSTRYNSSAATVLNSAPTVTAPSINDTIPQTNDILNCTGGTFSDHDGDSEQARYYKWYDSDVEIAGLTSQTLDLSLSGLDKADTIICSASVNDGAANSTWVNSSSTATIQNTAPTTAAPTLDPTTVYKTTAQVTCSNASVSDADADSITWHYQWYVNDVKTITTQTISNSSYSKGDELICEIWASDSESNSTRYNSSAATVLNSAPTVTAPSINDTIPQTNDILNCIGGTFSDHDGDSEQARYYKWYDSDVEIAGQTSQTLDLSLSGLNKADTIICSISVNDGAANSTWVNSSNTATIQNTAPTTTTPTLDPTTIYKTTAQVTCNNASASDADADSITWHYQWYVNDVKTITTQTISNSSYSKGDELICEIWASDTESNSTKYNSSAATVSNSAPNLTAPSINDTIPQTNDILNCTGGTFSDHDGDSEQARYYKWYDSDVEIAGLTSQTLDLSVPGLDKADTIICSISVNDGAANSTWINSSNTATIQNTAPTTAAPTLDPTTIYKTTTQVTCSNASVSDADEDTVTWYYQWYVNDVKTITTHAISNSSYSKGDELICEIWASDTECNSTKHNSSSVTVSNLAPNPPTVNTPLNGATNQELSVTLNITVTDPDTDAMNVTFWNNATGQQIGNLTNIADGSYANITWSGLSYSTTYYWYANSTDGEYMKKSNIWNFTTKDSPMFSIHLNSPDTQTATNDNTPDFNFTISGTGNSYNCNLYINGTSKGSNETVSNSTATILTSTTLTDGNYAWYINCTLAGIANSSETRTLTVDATSPVITILSPGTQSNYSTQTISFNITLNETGSWCGYSLDGAPNATMTSTAEMWGDINTSMTETQHTVQFFCNDTAGSMANTTERTFTIDITPPIYTPPPQAHD
ncbi:MAG: S8 family serine peptidase [archaeon]|nr:S8 family serine peptidase [archaeon]